MKQTTKKLAGLACGLALVLGCGAGTLTASATSVGDVIAHAYAVGLPESDIQACIAQYSGREYTSEQCDQAIAALDNWAKERDNKINEEINKGTTTVASGRKPHHGNHGKELPRCRQNCTDHCSCQERFLEHDAERKGGVHQQPPPPTSGMILYRT